MLDQKNLPTQAQVIIIGGGIIGTSIAYHLTKLGYKDVVLLERKQLTCGTTWHAAGLVATVGFSSETSINMAKYTRDLYQTLEEETGQATGFKQVGLLQIISDQERLHDRRRNSDYSRAYGIDIHEISPEEVKRTWPMLKTDDVIAGFINPGDGVINPIDVTMALAKGAKTGGVQIYEDTAVTGVKIAGNRVTGVSTNRGEIKAEVVVNAAGMWARELGKKLGVNIPLQAAEHYYLITEPIDGIHSKLPVVEDADAYSYIREEHGGLMIGMFEPVAAPWALDGIPKGFTFGEIKPDWDRMMPYMETAMSRVPVTETAGVNKFFCGPESFTPDLSPVMGEAPNLKNYFVCAGLNSLGILLGGGAGQIMAQWIVDGFPPVDVGEISIERFQDFHNTPKFLHDRTVEMLGLMYETGFPNKQFKSARNVRHSILHDRLKEAGAYFGASGGWEYPDWFAPKGIEPKVEYSWWRQNWFEYHAAEHKACREDVVLMDLSLMAKYIVQGRDAEKFLNWVCANDVAVPVGKIVYTQWLNERGKLVNDVTVTRLAEDKFLVVSSDAVYNQTRNWLNKQLPEDAHVFVFDATSAYAHLNIQGPKSRQLLSKLTSADLSNEAFPYMSYQEIDLDYANVLAMRITFQGELGWELYLPPEFTPRVFDKIVEAGADLGMKHAGIMTLYSLRGEKAYRDFGNDIDTLDTPLEAGFGRFVKLDKPGGFIGRDEVLKQKEAGVLKRRYLQFLVEDPEPLLYYNEIIFRDGEIVGDISAGAYGHTLGGAVGLGFVECEDGVTKEYINSGKWEVQIASEMYPVKPSLRPLYDPKNLKIKG
jgi:4-methylaminobutanoate oxidase (formaldehyde-forming)